MYAMILRSYYYSITYLLLVVQAWAQQSMQLRRSIFRLRRSHRAPAPLCMHAGRPPYNRTVAWTSSVVGATVTRTVAMHPRAANSRLTARWKIIVTAHSIFMLWFIQSAMRNESALTVRFRLRSSFTVSKHKSNKHHSNNHVHLNHSSLQHNCSTCDALKLLFHAGMLSSTAQPLSRNITSRHYGKPVIEEPKSTLTSFYLWHVISVWILRTE